MDDEVNQRSPHRPSIASSCTAASNSRRRPHQRSQVVHGQSPRDLRTSSVDDRAQREDQRGQAGAEQEDGVLPDDIVRLGCGRGELLRRPEEEVQRCGQLDQNMEPEGPGVPEVRERHAAIGSGVVRGLGVAGMSLDIWKA